MLSEISDVSNLINIDQNMADQSNLVGNKKLEFIGHSFLVRLERFIQCQQNDKWNNLKLNKAEFDLKFSARGGTKLRELIQLCKWNTFSACADQTDSISHCPDIVYIEIGSNDLCSISLTAKSFAKHIISFASYLRTGFEINIVIIGQILHRHSPTCNYKRSNQIDFDIHLTKKLTRPMIK